MDIINGIINEISPDYAYFDDRLIGQGDSVSEESKAMGDGPQDDKMDAPQSSNDSGEESHQRGLSLEKIECIRRQIYQEGLAPMDADGGVSFFVPVEESGMQPLSTSATIPPRLRFSRK